MSSIFGEAKPRDASQFTKQKRQERREQERIAKENERKRIAALDARLKICERKISTMDQRMTKLMKEIEVTKNGIQRVTLLQKIMTQVEFYFSDKNLTTDIFLLKHMYKKGNENDNWVSLKTIGTFQKIKQLCGGPNTKKHSKIGKATLANAIQFSSLLILDNNKSRVKRKDKFTGFNVYEVLSRSVIVSKLSPTMVTPTAVRSKVVEKCRGGTGDCSKWVPKCDPGVVLAALGPVFRAIWAPRRSKAQKH